MAPPPPQSKKKKQKNRKGAAVSPPTSPTTPSFPASPPHSHGQQGYPPPDELLATAHDLYRNMGLAHGGAAAGAGIMGMGGIGAGGGGIGFSFGQTIVGGTLPLQMPPGGGFGVSGDIRFGGEGAEGDAEYWAAFPPHIKAFVRAVWAQTVPAASAATEEVKAQAMYAIAQQMQAAFPTPHANGRGGVGAFDPALFADPAFTLSLEQAAAAFAGAAAGTGGVVISHDLYIGGPEAGTGPNGVMPGPGPTPSPPALIRKSAVAVDDHPVLQHAARTDTPHTHPAPQMPAPTTKPPQTHTHNHTHNHNHQGTPGVTGAQAVPGQGQGGGGSTLR